MRPLLLATALLLPVSAVATPAHAQATTSPAAGLPRPANDSLFRRARRLVLEGNGVAGRALVDSLLASAAPGTPAFGDALYWHGALAPTLAEAETDYRRVIVEYPLAFYADDALLAIAELEQGRGDRAAALAHLQRFVKEHPASPARGIAALGAARLAFEQRDNKVACAMITEARASVGSGDVELTNQIGYYSSRCPVAAAAPAQVAKIGSVPTRAATPVDTQSTGTRSGVVRVAPDSMPPAPAQTIAARDSAAVAVAAPPMVAPPVVAPPVVATPAPVKAPAPVVRATPPTVTSSKPARDTAAVPRRTAPLPRRDTVVKASAVAAIRPSAPPATVPSASSSRRRFTVQLAAFNTRPEAERFAAIVTRRGMQARVSGDEKPFRVRLGYYPTPAAAAAEVKNLKARGIDAFVAVESPTP